jgi:hypothetical protein
MHEKWWKIANECVLIKRFWVKVGDGMHLHLILDVSLFWSVYGFSFNNVWLKMFHYGKVGEASSPAERCEKGKGRMVDREDLDENMNCEGV